jgi:bifunctional non-homologous end joining protein LigD
LPSAPPPGNMREMLPLKPCLPTRAPSPPASPDWLHEIKHDGFRMLASRDGERVRVISRHGRDWGDRFPGIVAAVEALAVRSCIIDGEVIACDGDGLASFELLRYHRRDDPVTLVAFDLIEFDGRDLRTEPIEDRKAELARLLVGCRPALVVNRIFDAPGPDVFAQACSLAARGS